MNEETIEITIFFEQKPPAFGSDVLGVRMIELFGVCVPAHEIREFIPFSCFRALDNLDFWERLGDTLRSFFGADDIVLRVFGLPHLDELLTEKLCELDDAAYATLWQDVRARLECAAEQGHAFAQKLLSDYYGRFRDGFGGNVAKALYWYEEASKSGIIERYDDCEIWEDDEFDEEPELFSNCGAYMTDAKKREEHGNENSLLLRCPDFSEVRHDGDGIQTNLQDAEGC